MKGESSSRTIRTCVNKWKAISINNDEIEQALLQAYDLGRKDMAKHALYVVNKYVIANRSL